MLREITAVVSQLDPISLRELDRRASLQTRVDNKYFLRLGEFERFASAIRDTHAVLEINGRRVFGYHSQYFETPALDMYRAHVQGRRKRCKVRTRHYLDSGLCFFELKLKGGRGETIKRKLPYDPAERAVITDGALEFLGEHLHAFRDIDLDRPLLPLLTTHYRRITLVAKGAPERVTCDFDLCMSGGEGATAKMREEYMLVEVKSGRGRSESDRLLWSMGARPASGSKYCIGLSVLRPGMKSNAFRRQMRRYFDQPAPTPAATPGYDCDQLSSECLSGSRSRQHPSARWGKAREGVMSRKVATIQRTCR